MIKLKEIYTEMAMKAILAGQLSKAHFWTILCVCTHITFSTLLLLTLWDGKLPFAQAGHSIDFIA
jgi:hypothetical protein